MGGRGKQYRGGEKREQNLGNRKRVFFAPLPVESAAISVSLLSVFVVQEDLLENEVQENGKAEYMVFHNKIESQLPGSVNDMNKDEAEEK